MCHCRAACSDDTTEDQTHHPAGHDVCCCRAACFDFMAPQTVRNLLIWLQCFSLCPDAGSDRTDAVMTLCNKCALIPPMHTSIELVGTLRQIQKQICREVMVQILCTHLSKWNEVLYTGFAAWWESSQYVCPDSFELPERNSSNFPVAKCARVAS